MNKAALFLRFTNATLLIVIVTLTLTGLYGLVWHMPTWMFDLHRMASWAVVSLLPWKGIIILRSLKRGIGKRFKRVLIVTMSMFLMVWTIIVFVLGLYWAWSPGIERHWLYQTALNWHWYLALGLLLPFIFHLWHRWPRPRATDFASRRSALKLIGLGSAAVVLWGVSEIISVFREDPEQPRRASGSKETNSFEGMNFPASVMLGEGKMKVDIQIWRLAIKGAVEKPFSLDYDQILTHSRYEQVATLDCTDGWYTTQNWRGVPLVNLLAEAGVNKNAKGFTLRAISGYAMVFTLSEAEEILLATHVGEQVFDHLHGFPLRAVVPSRRGWHWVKWLVEVEVF